jgi:hypothetical protein
VDGAHPLLSKGDIERALAALADELGDSESTELFLVGGGALALVHDSRRTTRDVDAVILAPRRATISKTSGKTSMVLADLAHALVRGEHLRARQWVLDSADEGFDWSAVPEPTSLPREEMAVAAGVVELMAARAGTDAPAWTKGVGPLDEPLLLVPSARTMRRTRELCEREGPEGLRRRRVMALPNVLTFA